MIYKKHTAVRGKWIKGSDIQSGSRCIIVSETNPVESQFKNKDGSPKFQDVTQARFEGQAEAVNISLNRATLEALIDAFGEDSKGWINKALTAQTEKVVVSGKRVTAVYLVPEGYELGEDANGYVQIRKIGSEGAQPDAANEVPVVDPNEELDQISAEQLPF